MVENMRPGEEIEFRDGMRTVPGYIVDFLRGIECHRLTYEEAMTAANRKVQEEFLNAQQDAVLAAHFQEQR